MEVSEDTNEPLTSDKAVGTRSSPEISLSSRSDSSLTSTEAAEKCRSSRASLDLRRNTSHTSNMAVEASSASEVSLSSRSYQSLTPSEAVGAGCSSGASLSSWSDNSLAAVAATAPDCSWTAPLPPPRESSGTSLKADEGSCISQLSLSTPLHGADLGHAAMPQSDLTLSEALEPQNVQETSDCVIPKGKPEEEAGLPRHGQETVQESSAPQVRQRPSEPHVEVVSRVRKPLKLDEAVKRQLERHMVKMQIKRCFGSGLLQEALRDHPGATRLPSSSTQAHCAALPLTLPAQGQARSHQEEGSAAPWPTARVHSPCGNTHTRNTDACPLSVSSFCDCGRRGAS